MKVVKVLEFIDANEDALSKFEQEIKKKKYTVYVVEEHLLFSFGETLDSAENFINELEDSAFDLDIDYAKVKFLYLNPETGKLVQSQTAIKDFASENDLEEYQGGMPISVVPYLIEYVFQNVERFKVEIDENFNEEEIPSEAEKENFIDDFASDDSFVDDVSEIKKVEISSSEEVEILSEAPEQHSINEVEEEQSVVEEPVVEEKEITAGEEVEHYPETTHDYLLEKSIALFDSHYHVRLPRFDEVTNKELQKEVVDAQFKVSKARDKGIDAIYKRLKAETKNSKQAVETHVIKQAREAHEEVLNTIERNLAVDINKLLTENDAQYERDREAYVQSQIPNLRKKYDSEHFSDYQSVLSSEIDQLRNRSKREIEEENKRFADYVENVFKNSDEEIIDSVVLDDIIAEYNNVAEEQKELLMIHAKGLKGQIGETMSNIMQERDNLKDELHEFESKIEAQKIKEQERINAGVKAGIQEEQERLKKQTQEKLAKASEKEKELIQKMDALSITIKRLEEENKSLKREYIAPVEESSKKNSLTEEPMREIAYQKKDKRLTIAKLVVGSVIGVSMVFMAGIGVSNLMEIREELSQGNEIAQLRYLAELEADKKYDRVAKKMKELGYKKDSIALMYLENGFYTVALKTDSSILPEFYTFAEKQNTDTQKEIFENVKRKELLKGKKLQGVDMRLAVLENNAEEVIKLAQETDADSAKVAISYLISVKKLDEAKELLRTYPDEELSRKIDAIKQ